MKPRQSILDRRFRYVPSGSTDVRKTFARERKRMKQEQEQKEHQIVSIIRKRA